jgi:Enoyl-CoA hydratase/isomerase
MGCQYRRTQRTSGRPIRTPLPVPGEPPVPALACDYLVAARSARLGAVEATIGPHPLMGAIQRIAQRAGALRAKEMATLGRRYDPDTLAGWGLINLVVDDENWTPRRRRWVLSWPTGRPSPTLPPRRWFWSPSTTVSQPPTKRCALCRNRFGPRRTWLRGCGHFGRPGPGAARFVGR